MKNAKKYFDVKNLYCWDCGKVLTVSDKGEVSDGVRLEVKQGSDGTPSIVFKCKDCYKKSKKVNVPQACEVYSRVVGYIRPITQWNPGKQSEYEDRVTFQSK